MKKLNIVLTLSFIFLVLAKSNIYADSLYKNEDQSLFEITSGFDTKKESLTTFDKSRTITGIAKKGTNINITVHQKVLVRRNKKQEEAYKEIYKYSLTVGPSGYFAQNIDLPIGENIIVIASSRDEDVAYLSTIIKRKKAEIKRELEGNIALPISRK